MNTVRTGPFGMLPPIVKNLLIINGFFFFATFLLQTRDIDLVSIFGLHYFSASNFKLWQTITYMFMHGSFWHLFFNMFALWMFGSTLEQRLGAKRFLSYYIITGVGAALIHYIIVYFQIQPTMVLFDQFLNSPGLDTFRLLVEGNTDIRYQEMLSHNLAVLQQNPASLFELTSVIANLKANFLNSFVIIGASGSVFGLLLAFGMLYPNAEIYLYFLLPIKAKWLVIIYGVIELVFGVTGSNDGIAHFAHLGGMLFGIILILAWRRHDRNQKGYF